MTAYAPVIPTGSILPFGGPDYASAPPGFLFCEGATVSRTTYANLFATLVPNLGSVTISIASPAVITYSGTTPPKGDAFYLTTTGALPTGLSANTLYYIAHSSGTSYNLATSRANAYAGTFINTSGTQSGTQTLFACPYGLGDGSTTFTLPSTLGMVLAGVDNGTGNLSLAQSQGSYGNMGASGGEQGHTLTSPGELPAHNHPTSNTGALLGSGAGTAANLATSGGSFISGITIANTGSGGAHNNVQPTVVVSYIIKT